MQLARCRAAAGSGTRVAAASAAAQRPRVAPAAACAHAALQSQQARWPQQLRRAWKHAPQPLRGRPLTRLAAGASDSGSGGASNTSSSASGGSDSEAGPSSPSSPSSPSGGGSSGGSEDKKPAGGRSPAPPLVPAPPPAPAPGGRPSGGSSWRPFGWLGRLAGGLKLAPPLRLLLNLGMLVLLMRLWPLGGRMGLGEPEALVVAVPFSEFLKRVRHDDVSSVAIDGGHISFALKPSSMAPQELPAGAAGEAGRRAARVTFATQRPPDYALPYSVLEKNGVAFSAADKRGNRLLTVMVYALYGCLLLSALSRLPLRLPSRALAGRKHGRGGDAGGPPVTFADVAGVDEAKEELAEIVEYLRAPDKFSRLGARPPSGVLLVGPPGTGKTLLARAVAGEAGVPFFSIAASEFVELYVGMGAARVRGLFEGARREAPAIVFIDEVDAVAKGRDMRLRSVGNDEREQTLNQLLTELDGFDSDKDSVVICIAATNRPDVLDPALLRPGRFDRRVAVERPDKLGRQQILGVHLAHRGLPLAPDVCVGELASMTTGFTGADLANLVNEAALLAGRANKALVGREEFGSAVLRAVAGIEKKRSLLVGVEKHVVARHEVGHALVSTAVSRLLPGSPPVAKLSIIPRSGGALGFTYIPPNTEDRALMFDTELRGQLAMLMGGRAAEQLTCDAVSTGAADDIRRATDLALRCVSEFGLSPTVGPLNVGVLAAGGADDGAWLMRDNGTMAQLVEAEVRALLAGALTVAGAIISANQGVHEGLSELLTRQERVEGEALQRWLQHVQVPQQLRDYVLAGALPPASESPALQQLREAAAAAAAAVVSPPQPQQQQQQPAEPQLGGAGAAAAALPLPQLPWQLGRLADGR